MPAEDHLSDQQFEILRPHHSVRVGEHIYPASLTMRHGQSIEEGGITPVVRHAYIPMENGALIGVSDRGGDHFHLSANKFAVTNPQQRTGNERGLWTSIGTAHGINDLHNSLQSISKTTLDPDAIAENQRIITKQREAVQHWKNAGID